MLQVRVLPRVLGEAVGGYRKGHAASVFVPIDNRFALFYLHLLHTLLPC